MPPVEVISDAYKVGGIALVLLLVLCFAGHVTFRFMVKLIRDITAQNRQQQAAHVLVLETVVRECTKSNYAFVSASEHQTRALADLVTISRERPCFETQRLPAISQPPPITKSITRTPWPQIYPPKP